MGCSPLYCKSHGRVSPHWKCPARTVIWPKHQMLNMSAATKAKQKNQSSYENKKYAHAILPDDCKHGRRLKYIRTNCCLKGSFPTGRCIRTTCSAGTACFTRTACSSGATCFAGASRSPGAACSARTTRFTGAACSSRIACFAWANDLHEQSACIGQPPAREHQLIQFLIILCQSPKHAYERPGL